MPTNVIRSSASIGNRVLSSIIWDPHGQHLCNLHWHPSARLWSRSPSSTLSSWSLIFTKCAVLIPCKPLCKSENGDHWLPRSPAVTCDYGGYTDSSLHSCYCVSHSEKLHPAADLFQQREVSLPIYHGGTCLNLGVTIFKRHLRHMRRSP